jgi:AbrB family looped-hinge helix DNA binding protein
LAKQRTTVSTKGQVILPKTIRENRRWDTGTRLVVEETDAGVLLTEEPLFAPTTMEDVFGMLKFKGKPKTLKDMDAAIAVEVRRRH